MTVAFVGCTMLAAFTVPTEQPAKPLSGFSHLLCSQSSGTERRRRRRRRRKKTQFWVETTGLVFKPVVVVMQPRRRNIRSQGEILRLVSSYDENRWDGMRFSNHSCPNDPFTILELQNPSHDIRELHKFRRSPDFEAQNLWWKCRSSEETVPDGPDQISRSRLRACKVKLTSNLGRKAL